MVVIKLETNFQGTMIAFEIFEDKLDYEFGQLFKMIIHDIPIKT